MQERLQKLIAASGLMSRRAAEQVISAGRVTVNGVVAQLGQSADSETDEIRIDGEKLPRKKSHAYVMLNKPKGYVTTMQDEHGGTGAGCRPSAVSRVPFGYVFRGPAADER